MRVLTGLLSLLLILGLGLYLLIWQLTLTEPRALARPTSEDFQAMRPLLNEGMQARGQTLQFNEAQLWLLAQAGLAQAGVSVNQRFTIQDTTVTWQQDWPIKGFTDARYLPVNGHFESQAQAPFIKLTGLSINGWALPQWTVDLAWQQVKQRLPATSYLGLVDEVAIGSQLLTVKLKNSWSP